MINMVEKIVMNAMMMSELNKMIASGQVTNVCGECHKRTAQKDIIGLRKRDGRLHIICHDHFDVLKEATSIEDVDDD